MQKLWILSLSFESAYLFRPKSRWHPSVLLESTSTVVVGLTLPLHVQVVSNHCRMASQLTRGGEVVRECLMVWQRHLIERWIHRWALQWQGIFRWKALIAHGERLVDVSGVWMIRNSARHARAALRTQRDVSIALLLHFRIGFQSHVVEAARARYLLLIRWHRCRISSGKRSKERGTG